MNDRTRREFLADVGRGMFVASLGSALSMDLGLSPVMADDEISRLSFGKLEPLVSLMQETPADKLLPVFAKRLADGTDLQTLVAAGALANARTFGGQDYVGYHSLMALAPAWQMSQELPANEQALPIFKVLYRNTNRMQEKGGRKEEVLHEVPSAELKAVELTGESLQAATRSADMDRAERTFAAMAAEPDGEAFNHLQFSVQDEVDVHRVVLAWRSWALLDLTGRQHAHTLLRQSVRYCVDSEQSRIQRNRPALGVRQTLPKLIDEYKLLSRSLGDRPAEDAWVEKMSLTIYGGDREEAAEAVAAALAEGMSPEAVGEAISLAANRLVLCDPGRSERQASSDKPAGSVHGASVGVHASDAANAWRNIARVSNQRNTIASLIVGAYHTAGQSSGQSKHPHPLAEQSERIKAQDPEALLRQLSAAVEDRDQALAAALVQRMSNVSQSPRAVLDVLLRYAVSEDGALHAEKYYRTVSEEFAATRPAFRWRHLVALARVTASEYGYPAPGYTEACGLLKT